MPPGLEELEQEVRNNPRSRRFYDLAREYQKAGRLEEARSACEGGLGVYPSHIQARILLAQIHVASGNMEQGLSNVDRVLKAVPDNVGANHLAADIYYAQGQRELALKHYSIVQLFEPQREGMAERIAELSSSQTASSGPSKDEAGGESASEEAKPPGGKEEASQELSSDEEAPPASPDPVTPALDAGSAAGVSLDAVTEDPPPLPPETEDTESNEEAPPEEPAPASISDPRAKPHVEPVVPPFDPDQTRETGPLFVDEADAETSVDGSSEEEAVALEDVSPLDIAPNGVLDEVLAASEVEEGLNFDAEMPEIQSDVPEVPRRGETEAAEQDSAESPLRPTAYPVEHEEDASMDASLLGELEAGEDEDGSLDTQTLAELYEQQGYPEKAVEIYQRLLLKNPEDLGIQGKIHELMARMKGDQPEAEPVAQEEIAKALRQRRIRVLTDWLRLLKEDSHVS